MSKHSWFHVCRVMCHESRLLMILINHRWRCEIYTVVTDLFYPISVIKFGWLQLISFEQNKNKSRVIFMLDMPPPPPSCPIYCLKNTRWSLSLITQSVGFFKFVTFTLKLHPLNFLHLCSIIPFVHLSRRLSSFCNKSSRRFLILISLVRDLDFV